MRLAVLAFIFGFILVATESVAVEFRAGLDPAVDRLFDGNWMATQKIFEGDIIPTTEEGLSATVAPLGDPGWKTGRNTTGDTRHRSYLNDFEARLVSRSPEEAQFVFVQISHIGGVARASVVRLPLTGPTQCNRLFVESFHFRIRPHMKADHGTISIAGGFLVKGFCNRKCRQNILTLPEGHSFIRQNLFQIGLLEERVIESG